jgi:hypothetical protein
MSKEIDEVLKLIGDAPVVFWACPNKEHKYVTWTRTKDGMIPKCNECDTVGEIRGYK